MRVIFMGTPHFAVPALEALIGSKHEIVAVYSQPPRRAGRGMQVTRSPVHQIAERHRLPVLTPDSLKPAEVQAAFAAHKADIAVVAAYGLLLPQAILDAPKHGCINIHPSDLPRWRGAAPIQRTLMAGDNPTACCIMQMDAGLDTGAVLLREHFAIPAVMNYGGLHDVMAQTGAHQVLTVLTQFERGITHPTPQNNDGATYAAKITKADRVIDWTQAAQRILYQIRALSPSPGAITVLGDEIVKIFNARIEPGKPDFAPGIILDNDLLINAAAGTAVRVLELQRPSKTRQNASEALHSFGITPGMYAKNPIPA